MIFNISATQYVHAIGSAYVFHQITHDTVPVRITILLSIPVLVSLLSKQLSVDIYPLQTRTFDVGLLRTFSIADTRLATWFYIFSIAGCPLFYCYLCYFL